MKIRKGTAVWKTISGLTAVTLVFSFVLIDTLKIKNLEASALELPNPTSLLPVSKEYSYPVLRGLRLDPENPLKLDFVVDPADVDNLTREEASMLIRYFLAALTLPDQDLWVNLSPYEKDRIVPDNLSVTEMGRDMLAQDYVLKQLMSTLTYPENDTGKDFWKQTYDKVLQKVGTLNIPIDMFNKVWIVPDQALVYENNGFAVIKDASLKVMLEEDYLAKEKNNIDANLDDGQDVGKISSNVMREVVIPEIEDDVNYGRNFARLRQVYHSLVLGKWFKKKFQDSFYRHYMNQGKVKGVDTANKKDKQRIYETYVKAFEKGCYDYVKKQYDPGTDKKIRRRYFSGGVQFGGKAVVSSNVSPKELKEALQTSSLSKNAALIWLGADLRAVPSLVEYDEQGNARVDPVVYQKTVLRPAEDDAELQPFTGMDEALMTLPRRIEDLVLAKGVSDDTVRSVSAINSKISDIYQQMGLATDNYHNDVHNKVVTYGAMVLGDGAGLLNTKRDVVAMELGAALHDFHIRKKTVADSKGESTNTPANVEETLSQIKDLLGLQEYGSVSQQDSVTIAASNYSDPQMEGLKNQLGDFLKALLSNVSGVSVEDLFNEISALIRRTDFASNHPAPQQLSGERKGFIASFRKKMDQQFQSKDGLTTASIELLIIEMKQAQAEFDNLIAQDVIEGKLPSEAIKAAQNWAQRQLGIEIEYAKALQNVDAERRDVVNQQAQTLETADQLGYYYLSDWNMVQDVVTGLGTEVMANVPGSYPFFFQGLYFSSPEQIAATAAKLTSLPEVFKRNLLNNLDNFVQAATKAGENMPDVVPEFVRNIHKGAAAHWEKTKPLFEEGLYSKRNSQAASAIENLQDVENFGELYAFLDGLLEAESGLDVKEKLKVQKARKQIKSAEELIKTAPKISMNILVDSVTKGEGTRWEGLRGVAIDLLEIERPFAEVYKLIGDETKIAELEKYRTERLTTSSNKSVESVIKDLSGDIQTKARKAFQLEKFELSEASSATGQVKEDKVGGIDLQNLEVDALSGNAPITIAPFDVENFAGFDFEITKLDKYDGADAMLASFL